LSGEIFFYPTEERSVRGNRLKARGSRNEDEKQSSRRCDGRRVISSNATTEGRNGPPVRSLDDDLENCQLPAACRLDDVLWPGLECIITTATAAAAAVRRTELYRRRTFRVSVRP